MKNEASKLYGLVLAGGRSRRMKKEKFLLDYHGAPQVRYCFGLLEKVCTRVFVSIRSDQKETPELARYAQIHDQFEGDGPIVGMLSAMKTHSDISWLVLACDLPGVTGETLCALVQGRNRSKGTTAFRSPEDGLPEPLCAIYEPSSQKSLGDALNSGHRSPRKALVQAGAELIAPSNPRWLRNVNTPAERKGILRES